MSSANNRCEKGFDNLQEYAVICLEHYPDSFNRYKIGSMRQSRQAGLQERLFISPIFEHLHGHNNDFKLERV